MGQQNGRINLSVNASATGAAFTWLGGKGLFTATATFGGGTVKLQHNIPDAASIVGAGASTTWVDVKNIIATPVSLTSDGSIPFELPAGQIRCNIATATAVYATVIGMSQ